MFVTGVVNVGPTLTDSVNRRDESKGGGLWLVIFVVLYLTTHVGVGTRSSPWTMRGLQSTWGEVKSRGDNSLTPVTGHVPTRYTKSSTSSSVDHGRREGEITVSWNLLCTKSTIPTFYILRRTGEVYVTLLLSVEMTRFEDSKSTTNTETDRSNRTYRVLFVFDLGLTRTWFERPREDTTTGCHTSIRVELWET